MYRYCEAKLLVHTGGTSDPQERDGDEGADLPPVVPAGLRTRAGVRDPVRQSRVGGGRESGYREGRKAWGGIRDATMVWGLQAFKKSVNVNTRCRACCIILSSPTPAETTVPSGRHRSV